MFPSAPWPRFLFGLLIGGLFSASCIALAQQAPRDGHIPLSSFAHGQTFYIDKKSVHPIGGGKLQYKVIGNAGDDSKRVSQNEVDCSTGQIQSPMASWTDSGQGKASNRTAGPVVKTMLTDRTPLYHEMKSLCEQTLPRTKVRW